MDSRFSWIFKYKIHHLLFWVVYHYSWEALFQGGVKTAFCNLAYAPHLMKFIAVVVVQAIGVYFSLYYLIPRFLNKGKTFLFLILVGLTIIAMGVFIAFGYYITAFVFDKDVYKLFWIYGENPNILSILEYHTVPSSLSSMTLGLSIKLAKNYIESQKRQRLLEKEKYETELRFLKSQFNPHFLFNTINSIFVLINKNQAQATDTLAKFSELLRYQLYECNEPQIPLDREISYITSFIELEKIRQNDNFELQVDIDKNGFENSLIAPFILMPFLENSFKHLSTHSIKSNWIHLNINMENDTLIFLLKNSTSNDDLLSKEAVEYGGLGLKNVKRRLDLIYPQAYQLDIDTENDNFELKLILDLSKYTGTDQNQTKS